MDIIQTSLFTDEELYELAEERNQLVVKHNSLIQKTRYSLSTQQQKIILYLISKIKPDDDELKEYDFVKVSRTCLVNINELVHIKALANSRLEAELSNGEKIIVSRTYIPEIKRKIFKEV